MSLSTVERQHALTALAQAKQFEVLLSAHVVEPENALDHKHNSLVASVAQSVLGNSLKVDENAFQRSESEGKVAWTRSGPPSRSTGRSMGSKRNKNNTTRLPLALSPRRSACFRTPCAGSHRRKCT